MRHLLLHRLFCIALLGFSACKSQNSESNISAKPHPPTLKRELSKVTGSAVSFNIETFIRIRCSTYKHQFGDANPFLIDDTAKLQAISQRLAVLQLDTMDSEPDVRAKAVLFYNDQTQDTLCIGRFNISYRGQLLLADTELYRLIGIYSKK